MSSPIPSSVDARISDHTVSCDEAVEDTMSLTPSNDSTPKKPGFSLNALVMMAIKNSPDKKLTLQGIYSSIQDAHPYYRTTTVNWRNSIRHNLTIYENFVRVQQAPGEKCGYWTLNADSEDEMRVDRYGRLRPCLRKSSGKATNKSQDTPPSVEPLGVPEPLLLPAYVPTPIPAYSPALPFTPAPMLIPPANVEFQVFLEMLQQLQYHWIQPAFTPFPKID